MSAALHHGPAADVMRAEIADRSVDMVYADPPFNTGQVWTGKAGSFDDRWSRSDATDAGWRSLRDLTPDGAALVEACCHDAAMSAYLGAMAAILIECRRVLKPTGTLWLHFDDTAGAHLRVLCDVVFGPWNALGTLVWRRTAGAHSNTSKRWARVHDTVAVYARSRASRWRLWRIGRVPGDPCDPGNPVVVGGILGLDDGDGLNLTATSSERVGWPTQKPVALLELFIETATLPGDLVLDPTCGSGTTLVAARGLGRRAVGIDASADAIAVAARRLERAAPKQLGLDLGRAA